MERIPTAAVLIAAAAMGACALLWLSEGGAVDRGGAGGMPPAPVAALPTAAAGPGLAGRTDPPAPLLTSEAPPPSPEQAARRAKLEEVWARALVLHGLGRSAQALALLRRYLQPEAAFFADAGRAKALAAIRAAASRTVGVAEARRQLEDFVTEIRRWGNLRPPADADEATALEMQLRRSAEVVARLPNVRQRQVLMRHLRRFLMPRGELRSLTTSAAAAGRKGKGPDIDGMLDRVAAEEAGREEGTVPLPIDDPEQIEARRIEQLERLRQRGALSLLDTLHAGLAWLALHQAPDGHFSEQAALERVKQRDPENEAECRKVLRRRTDQYAVSSTALALMAFLDFRDQDASALFEPSIARAVAWLRSKQREDGLFANYGRSYYTDAIALMALAQAAAFTGDEGLRTAVARGLQALHRHRGPSGGYRYSSGQAGDLSVSGWVAQALEYALLAGVVIPDGMKGGLAEFLGGVWRGGERFGYVADGNTSRTLGPVGMLMGRILWEVIPEADAAAWRQWVRHGVGSRAPELYTLYYGVRMDVYLHGGLTEHWRTWLHELARKQIKGGAVAGAFFGTDRRLGRAGVPLETALALLTMEHALFLR